jgi:hypothetical protein
MGWQNTEVSRRWVSAMNLSLDLERGNFIGSGRRLKVFLVTLLGLAIANVVRCPSLLNRSRRILQRINPHKRRAAPCDQNRFMGLSDLFTYWESLVFASNIPTVFI